LIAQPWCKTSSELSHPFDITKVCQIVEHYPDLLPRRLTARNAAQGLGVAVVKNLGDLVCQNSWGTPLAHANAPSKGRDSFGSDDAGPELIAAI
jgi:hypothetical protein